MCTLSWIESPAGLDVFFNRDEQRGRGPEVPPALYTEGTIPYLAPLDGQAFGTWIAVNAAGVVIGLLNGYTDRKGEIQAHSRSRGLLVRDLASRLTNPVVQLSASDLAAYEPFQLVLLGAGCAHSYRWDGLEWHGPIPAKAPIASSGWNAAEVLPHRVSLWQSWNGDEPPRSVDEALAYHLYAPLGGDGFSPCMQRRDACTRSLCHLHVDSESVRIQYAAGPPLAKPLSTPIRLPRRKQPL